MTYSFIKNATLKFQREKKKLSKNVPEQVLVRILADVFQVSREAMSYRFQNLGYFEDVKQDELFGILQNSI